jgi:nitrous oxidase accessory protein NosD
MMNKGGFCFLVCMLMISSVFMPVSATALSEKTSHLLTKGNTLYVGGSGPNNYTKIQDAIDNANEGDTIFVYHRTYYEHTITISKKLNLIGEDRNTTIIDGQGLFSAGIHIEDGATIHGFTIQRFTIYDVTTGPGTGIFIDGNNITISDNIITMCNQGIFFKENCYQIEICNNVFFQNTYYSIYLQSRACSIHDNYFVSNQNFAIDVMMGTRLVSIDHNQFEDNDVGIWARSTRATISRNNFINNAKHIDLRWDVRFLTLPFVFFRTPSFSENYWDDWNGARPQIIHGYFVYWIILPPWDPSVEILVFSSPIVQFDWHPAQEPYDISLEM